MSVLIWKIWWLIGVVVLLLVGIYMTLTNKWDWKSNFEREEKALANSGNHTPNFFDYFSISVTWSIVICLVIGLLAFGWPLTSLIFLKRNLIK